MVAKDLFSISSSLAFLSLSLFSFFLSLLSPRVFFVVMNETNLTLNKWRRLSHKIEAAAEVAYGPAGSNLLASFVSTVKNVKGGWQIHFGLD